MWTFHINVSMFNRTVVDCSGLAMNEEDGRRMVQTLMERALRVAPSLAISERGRSFDSMTDLHVRSYVGEAK